ncbi:DUF488 family protein [Arthrobacter jiangjiafuii]|uniref:DUF488 family protein n=1 Tax=Arthrobacter jiangjiafuii TaxID=2817475 RepID=A0A975M3A0_9MICC|nr:DUF488 family protein [Arthrobacter jiangjiafuii]MBP3043493.1 DUF488 family protein [Arthrobacter jiangjiafuii]QWC09014.1 DUF488 family protein [Arthrobacter jiangjiafuii]
MASDQGQHGGIRVRRIYEEPDGGYRVLVDRLWPRGVSKEKAHLDEWLKELAPSTDLRKWYGHLQDRWDQFVQRYREELEGNTQVADFPAPVRPGRTPSCSAEPAAPPRTRPWFGGRAGKAREARRRGGRETGK